MLSDGFPFVAPIQKTVGSRSTKDKDISLRDRKREAICTVGRKDEELHASKKEHMPKWVHLLAD